MPKITRVRDLVPDGKNANKGTERGSGMLEHSLRSYGAGRSVLVDKHGRIMAGNKTVEMAASIGMDKVQVVQTDGRTLIVVQRTDLDLETDAKAKELAIADNRIAEVNLDWDAKVIAELCAETDMSKFFLENELAEILKSEAGDMSAPEPQIEKAAELQKKWGTERGQIWEIGRHRLMCGSATSAEDHTELLDGAKIDAVITDPPYGIGLKYDGFDDTPENVAKLIVEFMPLIKKWPVVAVSSGHTMMWDYPRPTWVLGWVMPQGAGPNKWGFTCFHPVLVWGGDPYLKEKLGGRPDCLVDTNGTREESEHPCPKPLSFWGWLIERTTTNANRKIFDPFCGAGTTLVAAEKMGRTGYGLELSHKYVAVALERMAAMGLEPKLLTKAVSA